MKVGDVVFWHDPDGNVGSGVGRVTSAEEGMLCLEMLSGSEAEVPPHEVTPVGDCDVVGVEATGQLLFYNAETHSVYTDGQIADDCPLLDAEELRRIAATR